MESKTPTTIELTDAIRYAKRWRSEESTYNKHRELHAFWVPKEDFQGILTEEVDAIRGYLGVDDFGIEKLMFVGTKLNEKTGAYEDMLPERMVGDNHIYDMTRPCPNMCDNSSVLNNILTEEGK